MKIAYIIPTLGNPGGIERVLSTKANYFVDSLGYEVHIIVGKKTSESLFYHFSDKITFHILDINVEKSKPKHFLFNENHQIYKNKISEILSKIKFDITISVFGPEYDFLYQLEDGSTKILEFHFSKNYLSHLVKGLTKTKKRWLNLIWVSFLQWRESYYTKKYKHIIVLTKKDKELWGNKNTFQVIPNPLSFKSSQKALLINKQITAMGRYTAQKGFDLLIKSFALISNEFPDWTLNIIGEGQDKKYLQQLINKLSLQEKIFLKNPINDVEKEMLETSVFVFSSRYEGFGLVLTEAMSCGVPCIAFDCECGPSEIIYDKKDGFLVELNNIRDFSLKMKILMSDYKLRQKMGIFAQVNIQRFEVDKVMILWQNFFNLIKQ